MRIGINAAVISGRMTGVGYFALSLVRALPQAGKDIEWVLLGTDPSVNTLPSGANVDLVGRQRLPSRVGRAAWQQWELPRIAGRAGVHLLYCPDYTRPIRSPVPVVNTIHDLSFYSSSPPFMSLASRLWKRTLAGMAIRHSARLIAVSEFTRTQILRRFRIDPRRVETIHEGAEEIAPQ